MSKNQFKGLANMKNVDALNYAPSNRSRGSLLRRMEEGGEVCEMDASGKPKKPCQKKYRSSGKSSSGGEAGLVGKIIGGLGMVGAAIGIGKYAKNN